MLMFNGSAYKIVNSKLNYLRPSLAQFIYSKFYQFSVQSEICKGFLKENYRFFKFRILW